MRRGVFDVVVDRAFPTLYKVAGAAIGEALAFVHLIGILWVFAKSCDGSHDLERGTGRIQAVARAIQQGVILIRRRSGEGWVGPRIAHGRKQVAVFRVEHHHRAPGLTELLKLVLQQVCRLHLQASIDGHVQISIAIKNSLHRRMVGLPAMAKQWQQFAIVITENVLRSPSMRVEDFYNRCVIVIALQCLQKISFCIRAVVCGPVGACPEVSKQMECRRSQRIMAGFSRGSLLRHGQAQADITIAVLLNLLPVAGRER